MWSLRGGSRVHKLNGDHGCEAHKWESRENGSVLEFCEVGMELEMTSAGLLQCRRGSRGSK